VALRATDRHRHGGRQGIPRHAWVFAEFETNLRRERQIEGIAAAKARGVYTGRKPRIDSATVRRLHEEQKLGPAAIAKQLGIGRASVYRVLAKTQAAHQRQAVPRVAAIVA